MGDKGLARPTDQALAVPVEPASGLAPSGFDPSRDALGVSQTVCFFPEEDDPENFDGSMMAWTFAVPKDMRAGPGIYELRFVRVLTEEERGKPSFQSATLKAIATEAGTAETGTGSVHEGAGRQASPEDSPTPTDKEVVSVLEEEIAQLLMGYPPEQAAKAPCEQTRYIVELCLSRLSRAGDE